MLFLFFTVIFAMFLLYLTGRNSKPPHHPGFYDDYGYRLHPMHPEFQFSRWDYYLQYQQTRFMYAMIFTALLILVVVWLQENKRDEKVPPRTEKPYRQPRKSASPQEEDIGYR